MPSSCEINANLFWHIRITHRFHRHHEPSTQNADLSATSPRVTRTAKQGTESACPLATFTASYRSRVPGKYSQEIYIYLYFLNSQQRNAPHSTNSWAAGRCTALTSIAPETDRLVATGWGYRLQATGYGWPGLAGLGWALSTAQCSRLAKPNQ